MCSARFFCCPDILIQRLKPPPNDPPNELRDGLEAKRWLKPQPPMPPLNRRGAVVIMGLVIMGLVVMGFVTRIGLL